MEIFQYENIAKEFHKTQKENHVKIYKKTLISVSEFDKIEKTKK